MILSWIVLLLIILSLVFGITQNSISAVSAAVAQGAQAGISIGISISGSICLWSGAAALMEKAGITPFLARLLSPLICKVFPSSKKDPELSSALTGNICANLLGLGNAATPQGIRAAGRMIKRPGIADDELCRLVVLNTASIQLIPANVAALRASLGCCSPFDILPAVWFTSFFSAGAGVCMAVLL